MTAENSRQFDASKIDGYYLPPGVLRAMSSDAAQKAGAEEFLKKAADGGLLIDLADLLILFNRPGFFLDKIAEKNYSALSAIVKEPVKNKTAVSAIRLLNQLGEDYLKGPAGGRIEKLCEPGHIFNGKDVDFLNEISGNFFTVSKIFNLTLAFFLVFAFSVGPIFIMTIHTTPDLVMYSYVLFLILGAIMLKLCYYLDLYDAVMKSFVMGVFNYYLYVNACFLMTGHEMIKNGYFYNVHFFNPLISPFFLLVSTLFMSAWVSASVDPADPARVKRICKFFGGDVEKTPGV